jgi:hormone-sensitive lipase
MSKVVDDIISEYDSIIKNLSERLDNPDKKPANHKKDSSRLTQVTQYLSQFNQVIQSDLFISGNQKFCEYTMTLLLNYLKKLTPYSKNLSNKYKRLKFDLTLTKIDLLTQSLPNSLNLSEDDFECLPDDHPRKIRASSITSTITEDQSLISKQLLPFIDKYNALKAVFYISTKYKSSSFKSMLTGTLLLYFFIFKSKCRRIIKKSDLNSNIEPMYQQWNVTESSLMKTFLPIIFPSISFNKMIYLPRLSPSILEPYHKPIEKQEHYIDLISQEPLLAGARYSFKQDPEGLRVPVRILSGFPLHKVHHEEIRENGSCCSSSASENLKPEALIIHIHGGGFIGQTSFTHENYTREWSKSLNIPVLSIDYRLAPKNQFPDALDDVWQAYTWIIKYAHKFLGILPHKIILAGDSAGGNFALGITIKAKTSGFRIPDGLMLIYPAVNMDITYVSHGGFDCLEDPILGYRGLLNIIQNYLGNKKNVRDPLVSPIFAEDSILTGFPRTKMIVSMKDPLRSDALRFADRLLSNEVDLEIYQYEGFIHGALNLGHSQGIPVFKRILKDSIDLLMKLMS